MKAGNTEFEVGTHVRVTYIHDVEDRALIGIEGTIAHPFRGLMVEAADHYSVGLYITAESAEKYGMSKGPLTQPAINLCIADEFEIIEPTVDDEPSSSFRS